MAEKKPKPKPKQRPKLTQKQRFIAAAKSVEADESGKTFERVLLKIVRRRIAITGK